MGLPKNLIPIEGLGLRSEGVLLLTNNLNFANKITFSNDKILRKYYARVDARNEKIDNKALDWLLNKKVITINNVRYSNFDVKLISKSEKKINLEFKFFERRSKGIKNLLNVCGFLPNKLVRKAYGPFTLEQVTSGGVREVSIPEEFKKYLVTPKFEKLLNPPETEEIRILKKEKEASEFQPFLTG